MAQTSVVDDGTFQHMLQREYLTSQSGHRRPLITAPQLRAARALLGIDQRRLAELSGLSLPTIQRMEASEAIIRGNVDSLMKLIGALDVAGIELITEGAASVTGGRGVRLKAGFDPAKTLGGDNAEAGVSGRTAT
jgi:transcriptional regulator with XRE-family HTH domain